jgi:hypothetical protein
MELFDPLPCPEVTTHKVDLTFQTLEIVFGFTALA